MSPEFSLVIPTTGSLANLKNLLTSLELLLEIDCTEILIIQNPPQKSIQILISEFKNLNIHIFETQPGVNRARNMGLKKSKGKYIFFLDDDCTMSEPSLLIQHRKAHTLNSWAFAVGGFYQNHNPSSIAKAYSEIQRDWLLRNRLDSSGECQMLLGGHFSIKNAKDLPLFDENIIYGGAETEYFFRLKVNGYRFLLIEASVNHSPQLTLALLIKKATLQGRTHKRLLLEGYFQQGLWITNNSSKKNKYKSIYTYFFNRQAFDKSSRELSFTRIRRTLSNFHQKICFYLENRRLF